MVGSPFRNEILSGSSGSRHRTRRELTRVYKKLRRYIPKQWREELAKETCISKGKCDINLTQADAHITYLETYGPLALLIFMRSRSIEELHPQHSGLFTREEKTEYMHFLVNLLEHYRNYAIRAMNCDVEAIDRLAELMAVLPSIDDLKVVVNMKGDGDDFFGQFQVYEENVILITMVLLWESYLKFRHIGPQGKGSDWHKLQNLAVIVFKKAQSSDMQLLHTLLEMASLQDQPSHHMQPRYSERHWDNDLPENTLYLFKFLPNLEDVAFYDVNKRLLYYEE